MKIRELDIIRGGLVAILLSGLAGPAAAATWSYTFDGDDTFGFVFRYMNSGQDSCEGSCGGQAPSCFCDEECEDYGDCCPDVCDACPDLPFCGTCVPVCADPLGNPYECGPDGCGA